MLQANPQLSWRAVERILIETANPVRTSSISSADYDPNSYGLLYHDKVGYGLVNATAAVIWAIKGEVAPPQDVHTYSMCFGS